MSSLRPFVPALCALSLAFGCAHPVSISHPVNLDGGGTVRVVFSAPVAGAHIHMDGDVVSGERAHTGSITVENVPPGRTDLYVVAYTTDTADKVEAFQSIDIRAGEVLEIPVKVPGSGDTSFAESFSLQVLGYVGAMALGMVAFVEFMVDDIVPGDDPFVPGF